MYLVHRHRPLCTVVLSLPVHPRRIAPRHVAVPDYRRRLRWSLGVEGERVGLLDAIVSVAGLDPVFVCRPLAEARDQALPDSGRVPWLEGMRRAVPAVEVADDRDSPRVGRPHGEVSTRDAVMVYKVRAEMVVQPQVAALVEQEQVVGREQGEVVAHRRFGDRAGGWLLAAASCVRHCAPRSRG